jgi:tetratricopeptide (TPR) repeat protein
VLDRFLRALGVSAEALPTDMDEQAALYRSQLVGRRALVVLDNAFSAEQVRPLLPGSSTCAVVVTSRRRLTELEGVHRLDLDTMDPDDALDFLSKLAGRRRVEAEPEAAGDIVQLCGCLPLALRIAGGRLQARSTWSISWLAARLADERTRLSELKVENLEVRASFEFSYRDLDTPTARMFRRLGLIAGPDLAAGVAAVLTDSTNEEAAAILEALADAHLLEPAPVTGRYRFHDLLRLYARERVQAEDEDRDRDAALRRMLQWYLETAHAAAGLLDPGRRLLHESPRRPASAVFLTREEALSWLEMERVNLVAAVHQAANRSFHQVAWQLADALWGFFQLRKHWADWQDTHQIGLAAAREAHDPEAEAWMLTGLGAPHWELHEYDEAIGYHEQALAICQQIGNLWGEGRALGNLGIAYQSLQQFDRAIGYYEHALAIYQQIGERRGEYINLINLGEAHQGLRQFDRAIGYYEQALAICQQIGERRGESLVFLNYGETSRGLERFDQAIEYYQQALEICREAQDRYREAEALDGLGEACRALGSFEKAIAYFREALDIRRETEDRYGEGMTLNHLGLALQRLHGTDAARPCWREALAIFTDLGAPEADEIRTHLEGEPGTNAGSAGSSPNWACA